MNRILLIALFAFTATVLCAGDEQGSWPAPNGYSAIKTAYCGQGRRIVALFVNLPTGRSARIGGSDARGIEALWSADSHYVSVSCERSHNWEDASLYRVENGRIFPIDLPPHMEASNYPPDHSKDQQVGFGHSQAIRALRWLSNTRLEFVSEAEAALYDARDNDHQKMLSIVEIEQHIIVEISEGKARIIKSFPQPKT